MESIDASADIEEQLDKIQDEIDQIDKDICTHEIEKKHHSDKLIYHNEKIAQLQQLKKIKSIQKTIY